jgi:hypothetical protein
VFALTNDLKPGALQRAHRIHMIDSGNLRHGSHLNFDFAKLRVREAVFQCCQILANGILDIGEGFGFGITLRPAAGECGNGDADPVFAAVNGNLVIHAALQMKV